MPSSMLICKEITEAAPTLVFSRGLQSCLSLMRATQGTVRMPDLPCGLQEERGGGVCVIIDKGLYLLNIFRTLGSLGTKRIWLPLLESSLWDLSQGKLGKVICQNAVLDRSTCDCLGCGAGRAASVHALLELLTPPQSLHVILYTCIYKMATAALRRRSVFSGHAQHPLPVSTRSPGFPVS